MNGSIFRVFIRSTGVLLLLTAAAKIYSATGTARILTATDPLIHLKYHTIMISVGLLEFAIALYLFFGRNAGLKPWLVLWLSSNFMMYRFANDLLHIKLCPCLGTIGDLLHIPKQIMDFSLLAMVLYLFFGSTYFLLRAWNTDLQAAEPKASPSDQAVSSALAEEV